MKNLLLLSIATLAIAIVGCSGEPTATDSGTDAKTPETTTTATSDKAEEGTSTAVAEMSKCDKCGMEAPKAEMTMVDNKSLCTHCKPADAGAADDGHDHAPGETH